MTTLRSDLRLTHLTRLLKTDRVSKVLGKRRLLIESIFIDIPEAPQSLLQDSLSIQSEFTVLPLIGGYESTTKTIARKRGSQKTSQKMDYKPPTSTSKSIK